MISERTQFLRSRPRNSVYSKNTQSKYFTFDEYREHVKTLQTDKDDTLVYLYTTDQGKQHSFIEAANAKSYDVLLMDAIIDSHFVNALEPKLEKVQFKRVDSETVDKLIPKDEKIESVLSKEEEEKLKGIFEKAVNNKNMILSVDSYSPDQMPVVVTMSEWMRRMKDMARTGGGVRYGLYGKHARQLQREHQREPRHCSENTEG